MFKVRNAFVDVIGYLKSSDVFSLYCQFRQVRYRHLYCSKTQ